MMKLKLVVAGVMLLLSVPSVSFAKDDSGIYLVGTVGQTSQLNNVDSTSSLSGLIGYQFSRYFAVEGGMSALAADASYTSAQTKTIAGTSYSFTSSTLGGTELAAVLKLPVGDDFSLFLRLGTVSMEREYKPASVEVEEKWTGTTQGLGAQYIIPYGIKFGKGTLNIGLRAGVNRYSLKNSDGSESETPTSTYVGGVIKF